MIADLHDADGLPLTVDLSTVKTIEPAGGQTILHFADGTRVIVSDEVHAIGPAKALASPKSA